MIDENEPRFLKTAELINDRIKFDIERFKTKYFYESTPAFASELLEKRYQVYDKFEWDASATTAAKESASDNAILSSEYIKQMIDSFQIKLEEKEEVKQAAPEGQEFIFDPKELDI
jgi:hypothetical protein